MGCISSKEDPEAVAKEKEERWSILLNWLKSAPGADQKIKNLFIELDKGELPCCCCYDYDYAARCACALPGTLPTPFCSFAPRGVNLDVGHGQNDDEFSTFRPT